uniref:Secreted protein n=1 Tax=Angiostrongylus cantonensis TaxID=6313 RepID=A0A0K0CXI3_ANGCA
MFLMEIEASEWMLRLLHMKITVLEVVAIFGQALENVWRRRGVCVRERGKEQNQTNQTVAALTSSTDKHEHRSCSCCFYPLKNTWRTAIDSAI